MKKLILILGLVTASLFGAVLFDSQTAYAATGEVIDRSTIKIGEQVFFDSDMDATFRYEETNPTDNCPDKIDGFSNGSDFTPGNTPADATLTVRTSTAGSSNCSEREETVTFGSSRSNFLKAFVWVDENTIQGSDGKLTFSRNGTSNVFVSEKEYSSDSGSVKCSDTLTISANNQALALTERKGREIANHDYDWYPFRPGDRVQNDETKCWEAPVINGLAISGSPQGGNEGGAPGAGNSGTGAENQPSCESEGGSLSWILCPILYLGDAVVRKLDQALIGLLSVPNDYIENDQLREAWSRLRTISYVILVPIMLVMVISTALGFEFFSAYTVKKALPRLIAATMFIALSFELTKFLVVFTNNIGTGIYGLVIGAFAGANEISLASVFSPNNSDSVAAVPILGLGITGVLAVGSIGILLSYLLVAVVGLAIGFFLLSFRQMLIIALMLVAPLAILAWIFPGNDRLWKLWWGTFSKLLLLFPLIMLLVAVGKSFALLVATEDGSFVSTILKLAAYVGPYFLIPATFKFAGGTFATLAGMANDRGRGLFDRNKKYRQAQMAQNWEHRGSRRVLQGRAEAVRRLQARGSRGGLGAFASRGLAKTIGGYNLEAAMSARQASVGKEVNDQIATGRDDSVRGLAAAHSYERAKSTGWEKALKESEEAKARGDYNNQYVRMDGNKRQYKSIGGAWIDEGYVREGMSRWGNDTFAQQAALSYEMRKAMTGDQVAGISQNYSDLANSWGMSGTEAGGAWIGAAFENQGQHIEYKNTDFAYENGKVKGPGTLNAAKFVNEVYEKKGSYPLAQMSGHTIEQLKNAYDAGDDTVKARVREIAETFTFRSGGVQAVEGETPIPGQRGGTREVSAPGAASVNKQVKELYDHVNPDQQSPTMSSWGGPPA